MPVEALPAFESSSKWNRKAKRINRFILKSGNFGHSRGNSYYSKVSLCGEKVLLNGAPSR